MKIKRNIKLIITFTLSLHFLNLAKDLKILHLSFHKGCIDDFAYIAKKINLNLTSWFILESHESAKKFYATNYDLNIYNIRKEDANRIWEHNKDFFDTFDAIITSDTVPLSRIFLQNNHWNKPLIIWVCNRFDRRAGYDKVNYPFPDEEYYELIQSACTQPHVFIASYTPYEIEYAQTKNVHLPPLIIRPIGLVNKESDLELKSLIPETINKSNTIFLAPRFFQNSHLEFVLNKCKEHDITIYYGKYNGAADLIGFKGILHFPYQASVLSLFENMHNGMVYFIPSPTFIAHLLKDQGDIIPHFWQPGSLGGERAPEFWHSEFYRPEFEPLFIYFDSWEDLKIKIETTNYEAMAKQIKAFAQWHSQTTLLQWAQLFEKVKYHEHLKIK